VNRVASKRSQVIAEGWKGKSDGAEKSG
jgi:hypothetical protein